MNLEMVREEEVLVVAVDSPRMEAPDAGTFRDALFEEIEKGTKQIVLDLKLVKFIDSTSIGAIVSVLKKLGRDGEIVIASATGSVRNVFRLTRMDKVLRLTEDRNEALRLLSR